jgi:hypothetical protein
MRRVESGRRTDRPSPYRVGPGVARVVLCGLLPAAWAGGGMAAGAGAGTPALASLATHAAARAELTAAQIVEKNAAARGGVEAWRKIRTMGWIGHLESPGSAMPRLPFVLEQKRPNKTHFEINSMGQRSLRVFDGTRGWRVRPDGNGGADVQAFTFDEIKFAKGAQGIDGPLIDYAAKGSTVALEGVEEVEGRKNYHISVRLASGERHDVWIDAETFLDTKYDRLSYSARGVPGMVSVFYRDYRTFDGLQIPTILEIGVGSARAPDKMIIDKVALNPPIDDKEFARPGGMHRGRMATIDIKPAPGMPGAGPMTQPAASIAGPAPERK